MTLIVIGLIAVLAATIIWRRQNERYMHNLLMDFERSFPGRCPICSYDRFGASIGILTNKAPHQCPEEARL